MPIEGPVQGAGQGAFAPILPPSVFSPEDVKALVAKADAGLTPDQLVANPNVLQTNRTMSAVPTDANVPALPPGNPNNPGKLVARNGNEGGIGVAAPGRQINKEFDASDNVAFLIAYSAFINMQKNLAVAVGLLGAQNVKQEFSTAKEIATQDINLANQEAAQGYIKAAMGAVTVAMSAVTAVRMGKTGLGDKNPVSDSDVTRLSMQNQVGTGLVGIGENIGTSVVATEKGATQAIIEILKETLSLAQQKGASLNETAKNAQSAADQAIQAMQQLLQQNIQARTLGNH